MKKVITYGTFDLLHQGHINILRRAKALGDFLIVGVTSDAYDRYRGKLNVRQPVTERIAAVRDTGFADQIIIEDYEGQKIEDIKKYGVDVITLGSDWTGKVDYLKKYCDVVYLPRTPNISSTLLRTSGTIFRLGIMCDYPFDEDNLDELKFVSGVDINGLYAPGQDVSELCNKRSLRDFSSDRDAFIEHVDIVFIDSSAPHCGNDIRAFLNAGKHVIAIHSCSLSATELQSLDKLARHNGLSFLAGSPLANLTSYTKLINIALSGAIGTLRGVELSISDPHAPDDMQLLLRRLAPTSLLPVTQLIGENIKHVSSQVYGEANGNMLGVCDVQTKDGFAHIKLTRDSRTECRCIIQGDSAYIKVPAPWWDMDYFEIRYASGKIKKFSWPMNGKAIRYQLADVVKGIIEEKYNSSQMSMHLELARLADNIFIS